MNTAPVVQVPAVGCPCGSATPLRDAFRTDTRRYVRCPACDLVFRYPRPARDTVESYYREAYDSDYGEAESSDDRSPVFHSVLDHLSAYRTPPGAVLDIGCGDGEFLVLCRKAGWDCYGIELSERAAARAAGKGLTMLPHRFLVRGDANERFDAVTLINVLETVADPLTMLRQAASVLASDGILLVRATNGTFHLRMRGPARWVGSQYDQAFHWYLFTSRALRHLMSSAGLRVLGVRNSRPSRGPLLPARSLWSRLKWTASRGCIWPLAEILFAITGGRALFAPSFEMVAQRREGGR